MGIDGLNIMVTGAAKGIGKSIAEIMGARGANLSLCDIEESMLCTTAGEIAARGVRSVWRRTDVSDQAQVDKFVDFTRRELGEIDVLVNNAGIYILRSIDEISNEEWDRVMAVNLRSCFMFCKAVLPGMRERKFGRIINMASAAGKSGGTTCGAHYAASKGGILAFTRYLAKQVGMEGVTVNAVAPSSIAADMVLGLSSEDQRKAIDVTVVKRFGRVDEVAEAVCYLADRNSGFVTGETINVNGGVIMD